MVFFRFGFIRIAEFLIMRTLRLLSFGPSCSCWTAQVAPSYVASQRVCTSAFAAHEFAAGIRFQEQGGIRDSVQEVRSRAAERSFGSSLRGFSDLSTTIYGGFGVPGGLVNCQRRLYSKVASKKGKRSEKDVLLEDREAEKDVLLEERGEDVVGEGEVEKLDGRKKKKKKSKELPENGDALGMDDGVANVHNLVSEDRPDAELLTKLKEKKKTKNKLKHEELETENCDSGTVLNGAGTAENQETTLQTEAKGKKNLKNKTKRRESEDELLEETDPESASVLEDVLAEELEERLDDDDFWEDDFEPEAELNDGGDGGGIVLGDAPWAKTALELAEKVVAEFNGSLEIFAFKVSKDSGIIRVRVDKLSDKYGSPTMDEIQQFSSSYSKLLDKAGEAKTIPDDLALEVSSPGAERVVRIPQDLERFKDLPMYVRYIESSGDSGAETPEKDGIMELESVDMQVGSAKWKLADVRINRDLAGKGRGLTRKQRDWRVDLSFESTQLVRLYIDL